MKPNPFLRPAPWLLFAIVFSILASGAELGIAGMLGYIVDIPQDAVLSILLLGALLLLSMGASFAQKMFYNRYAANVQSQLRMKCAEAVMHGTAAVTCGKQFGDVLARVNEDVHAIYSFFEETVSGFIQGMISLILGFVFLARMDARLALLVVSGSALLLFVTLLFNIPIKKAHRRWRESQSEMSVVAQDILEGQLDIKAMGLEAGVLRKFEKSVRTRETAFFRRNKIRAWNRATSMLFAVLVFLVVPGYGALRILDGAFTVGMVLACIQSARMISSPLQGIEYQLSSFASVKVNMHRVFDILKTERERAGGIAFAFSANGPIVRFSDVHFRYGPQEVLSGMSFSVNRGELVAIVGASGSGKSTVLQLILGLYPAQGQISVGGHDVQAWDLAALRAHTALVQQSDFLFPGSIRENLCCGQSHSEEEIGNAVRRAGLTEWLHAQPGGLDAQVGEQGALLSGGLKQRVSLARALLREPELLLLDEPTAALDAQTEEAILRDLIRIKERSTCILVAHRLAAITEADRILLIEEGRIAEQGTHEELLARKGAYWKLFHAQAEEGSDE